MNVKKIIKGIIGLGAMAGVAYAAYKIGESNGKINERFREKYGDDEDDEYRFYDNMIEPDDDCLAPKKEYTPSFSVSIHNFAPLDSIKVDGIADKDMDTAAKVISALRKAGYIGDEYSNYIIPVNITTEVYFRLRGDLH